MTGGIRISLGQRKPSGSRAVAAGGGSGKKQDPILIRKSLIDFRTKIADRIQHENRSPFFPERFLIGIAIAIEKINSGSDFDPEITDRFSYENRIPIYRSDCGNLSRAVFLSRIDFEMKIGIRF
jgi:hypothetical protein